MKQVPCSLEVPEYFRNPTHCVSVLLVGTGGTGSQMLYNLARINTALIGLGHMGINVMAMDFDKVSESNIGRQLFFEGDIGRNKAEVLIERINRYYGFSWLAMPYCFSKKMREEVKSHNLTITCVDSIKARRNISKYINRSSAGKSPYDQRYFWVDIGNTFDKGQVVMCTLPSSKKPMPVKTAHSQSVFLPSIIDITDDYKGMREPRNVPTCSLAQALGRQDLFVNSLLATQASALIWKLFREKQLSYHGCYVNAARSCVTPIKITLTSKK